MTKTTCKLISLLALVLINLAAIPIALFSLFDTESGTSLFSLDYLFAFATVFIPNLAAVSLFIFTRRGAMTEFYICLVLAVIIAALLANLVFTFNYAMLSTIMISICSLAATVLMIKPDILSMSKSPKK